jgi:integrase
LLTPKGIHALEPKAATYEVRDGSGLFLRVLPTGRKVFRWLGPPCSCRPKPHRHPETIGAFGDGTRGTVSLLHARTRVEELRAAAPKMEGTPDVRTVGDLVDVFYKESILRRRKRPAPALRTLTKDVKAIIGTLPLAHLDSRAASRPAAACVDRKAKAHALTVLALVKQMTKWGTAHGYLKADPGAPLDGRDIGAVSNKSKRWLNAEELSLLLPAIDVAAVEEPTRLGLLLLLATGLRQAELVTLRWDDVDLAGDKVVRIRPVNQKLGLAAARTADVYVQPLSPLALTLFARLQTLTGTEVHCFASRSEHLTDKALNRALARLVKDDAKLSKLPHFSAHAFRKSLRTWCSQVGLPPHVGELLLGHSLNALLRSGVSDTYDRHDYVDEKRRALDGWGDHLERLANGKPARVVAIR